MVQIEELTRLCNSSIASELCDYVDVQKQSITKTADISADPHAREAARATALFRTAKAVASFFKKYVPSQTLLTPAVCKDPEALDIAFMHQIRPEHVEKLIQTFNHSQRVRMINEEVGIASAVQPSVLEMLGLTDIKETLRFAEQQYGSNPSLQVSKSGLLSVLDYANSQTATFRAVNGAALCTAYYGVKLFSEMMAFFTLTLDDAVGKFCESKFFGRSNIVAYKGIYTNDAGAIFRKAMLENAVGSGKIIPFPNFLSATLDPTCNYARDRPFEGYSIELKLRLPKAFDASFFNDAGNNGETEVIAPRGLKFIVVSKYQAKLGTNHAQDIPELIDGYALEPR